MQKNLVSKLLFLFVFVFFLYKSSSALLLPETPDGKIGKNYQLYGCFSSGLGISKGNFELSFFNNFGLRSNLGLDSIDFGLFYNTFATFMGLTTNFKYGFIRNQNLSSALDLSFSKPFTEGFLIKSGLAFNFTPFPFFEFIISSYYIYSFNEMHATENIVIPSGYGLYFFSGIEFIPPFAIDNTIALGCGYLYLPDNIPDSQRFFNQFYINMFVRYALNEPRVEKKPFSFSNNIKKDLKEEKNINENVLIAKELIKVKEYKKAIPVLEDALYYYPDNFMLNYLIADCYYNTGDKIKSYIYYKKASKINTVDHKLKDLLINLEMEIKHEEK